ncbi:putative F-box/LRR-repeat protein at3g59230 [Phtheirospermum japonicum]|uniref:Putative F-box/LRR-repeat protein at3g59230 n=1 Tax=Phtheirospermum japonicum TaxID=374723 RepID=A0A830BRJ6_9LAMI|nr:putative F-box/LRR-repeat protein at3g59230 [Phtheirospermum japonicum]
MKKRVAAEFVLPEAIIHHIQSFLDGKQAAQTTILSKSWHTAWLTRPNLDFDQRLFPNCGDEFSEFTRTTLLRYQDLNLKIESFKLRMKGWEKYSHPLANVLIAKAIENGATDLNFELSPSTLMFVLQKNSKK